MNDTEARIAVDIGNSFMKFGLFSNNPKQNEFPNPESTCIEMTSVFSDLSNWLLEQGKHFRRLDWTISSVNEKRTLSLRHWIERHRPWDSFRTVELKDIPLTVQYDFPEKLGIDRAIAAFAAKRLLQRPGPILVVDIGTATTIDLVDCAGTYAGGSILPGPQIASQVLYERTERLPRTGWHLPHRNSSASEIKEVRSEIAEPEPSYPATNTENAIRVGICSSLIGAIFSFYLDAFLKFYGANDAGKSIPIVIAERGTRLIEKPLSDLFDRATMAFGKLEKPSITTCCCLILSGLACLNKEENRHA